MQEHKTGWFGKQVQCCRGDQIIDWLSDKITQDQKKVKLICQKMLD